MATRGSRGPGRAKGGAKGGATRFTGRRETERLEKGRRLTASSRRWLERQLNDPYVAEAKRRGFRSRAAFKLLELDDRLRFLKRGARVLDLGAAPGGWTQVAIDKVGPHGTVVAIDIGEMEPLAGARVIRGDATDPAFGPKAIEALGGAADVVLSDMAPAATGHAATDHLRIVGLVEGALALAEEVLAPGGAFVAKVWHGGTEGGLLAQLKRRFASVRHAKPPASRKESAETYVVATGFRPA